MWHYLFMGSKDDLTYSYFGKSYRENYKRLRLERILIWSVIDFLIVAIAFIVLLFSFAVVRVDLEDMRGAFILALILVIAPLIMFLITSIVSFNSVRDVELEKDDDWLGKKYYFLNKIVKGSAFKRMRALIIFFSTISFFTFVFTFAIIQPSVFSKPVNRDSLVSVNGEIEYLEVEKPKSTYVYFGFKDNDTTYCICFDPYDACNKTIETDDLVGQTVSILAEPARKLSSPNEHGRTYYARVYEFTTIEKEYLTYDGYLVYFNESKKMTIGLYIFSLSTGTIFALVSVAATTYTIVCAKKYEKISARHLLQLLNSLKQD